MGAGAAEEDTVSGNAAVDAAAASLMYISQDTPNRSWQPSTSPDDCGVNKGSLALAHAVRSYIIKKKPSSLPITPDRLASEWGNGLSHQEKEHISNAIAGKLGALHGRKIVCEGR